MVYFRTIWVQQKADTYLLCLLLSTIIAYGSIKILLKKIIRENKEREKKRKREKKRVTTSLSVDLVKRLDCCSLDVC